MPQPSPSPTPKARILANMRLPDVEGYAIRCFGDYLPPRPPGAPPWRAELERRNLADILPLIPAAEKPDILLCASPEYLPIPWDIRAFAGPKVLLITDWNVCLRFLPDLCPLFDFCFTDWPGYRLLRRAGVANVFHQPLFGHDPARFRVLDGQEGRAVLRNLDVSFCGNLNAGMHGERNRLLARMARWAHRSGRQVHLRQAFGDAYIDVLNRSRLVFNYSIRGEANMRLFETMACGAAPLVEETNQEVAILFQEGRHYFRYPIGGLEAKLDELLSQPERIAEVAEAARREVGRFTKAKQLDALLDAVCRDGAAQEHTGAAASASASSPSSSPLSSSPASRKALAKIRVLGMGYTIPEALGEIQARTLECPDLGREALPGLLSALAAQSQDPAALPARKALNHLLGDPALPDVLRHFLRLQDGLRAQDWSGVERSARDCLAALERADSSLLEPRGILYSMLLPPVDLGKGMNADINRAYLEDLTGKGLGSKGLLDRHCGFALAEASLARGAATEALAATEPRDKLHDASLDRYRLRLSAGLLLGDGATVRSICRDWFEDSPLDTAAWERMVAALEKTGDGEGRRAFLGEIHVLAHYFLDSEQAARILRLMGLGA